MNMMRPDNHEAAMARADLYKLANYSFKLFKMIHDGDELEGWVQAKVTKAADYIASVYHYMEYEMKFSEYGDKLENSDVYSEAVKREFKQKLLEAKQKLEKLKQVHEEDDLKKVGDKKKTATGELTKTATGVVHKRTQYSDDESGEVNKTHAKSKSAAEKKSEAPKQKQSKTGTWGMKDGQKFDNRNKKVKETVVPSPPDGATAPPPKGKDGKYPIVTSGPHKGKRWSPQTPGPTNPNFKELSPAKESLKGGQKNLDKNKNGKLDKDDFAKLRAGKNVKKVVSEKSGAGKTALKGLSGAAALYFGGKAVQQAARNADNNAKAKATAASAAAPASTPVKPGTTPEQAKLDPRYKTDPNFKKEVDTAMQIGVKETAISGAPQKSGISATAKTTVPGMRATQQDLKKANSSAALGEGKCNQTPKGKSCPVHGLKECGSMYEGHAKNLKQQAAIAIAKKKAK